MNAFLVGLLSVAALAACSSNHDISSGEDSSAVTSDTLDAHCQSACEILVGCDAAGSSGDCLCAEGDVCDCTTTREPRTMAECTSDCVETFDAALSQGLAGCAAAATDLFACIEANACDAVGTSEEEPGQCDALAERTGDACNVGGNDDSVPAPETGAVLCGSSGSVREPYDQVAPGVVCEATWDGCYDHDYRVLCVDPDGTGTVLRCSCIVDQTVESVFEDTAACTATGPDVSIVNAACGWDVP